MRMVILFCLILPCFGEMVKKSKRVCRYKTVGTFKKKKKWVCRWKSEYVLADRRCVKPVKTHDFQRIAQFLGPRAPYKPVYRYTQQDLPRSLCPAKNSYHHGFSLSGDYWRQGRSAKKLRLATNNLNRIIRSTDYLDRVANAIHPLIAERLHRTDYRAHFSRKRWWKSRRPHLCSKTIPYGGRGDLTDQIYHGVLHNIGLSDHDQIGKLRNLLKAY